MKALSFLGTGNYKSVTYIWRGEKEYTTHVFPEAVVRIFEPEKLLLFVTTQAKQHSHFRTLKERLGERIYPVDIPEGKSEAELWQIFERCVEVVSPGDEILLDVTHAFRSLPLIVFTVAAYLRRTKNVSVSYIIYGAFEAKDEHNRAPIFDLTPLLDLLDWISGVEAFLSRSDAGLLAEKMQATQARLWKMHIEKNLPKRLQAVGRSLSRLSQALRLSRSIEIMRIAKALIPQLKDAYEEIEKWAKPLTVIIDQVQREVSQLAHESPDRLDINQLEKQLKLIEYYLEKGLTVQAITLAREWVVSWVCFQRGEGDWLDKKYREEEIEKALGAARAQLQGINTEVPYWFAQMPQAEKVAKLWDWLTELRNDIAHCGMSKQALSSENVENKAKEIPGRLRSLLNNGS